MISLVVTNIFLTVIGFFFVFKALLSIKDELRQEEVEEQQPITPDDAAKRVAYGLDSDLRQLREMRFSPPKALVKNERRQAAIPQRVRNSR